MSEHGPKVLHKPLENAYEFFEPDRVEQRKIGREPFKPHKSHEEMKALNEALKALDEHPTTDEFSKIAVKHLLDEATESVVKGKEHLEAEKVGADAEVKDLKDELDEALKVYNQAVLDSGDPTKGNLFDAGRRFTAAKHEMERVQKICDEAKMKQIEIDKNLKDVEDVEKELNNPTSETKSKDLKKAKTATAAVMVKLQHVAHGITHRSSAPQPQHKKESFWSKVKDSFSHAHLVAGAGVMGAITWYLGIVWGEVTGGWKALGGGGGGGHAKKDHH